MQSKFISGLTFLIFANLLVKPFWLFGIDRTVQNMVGTETYGSYFAAYNLAFLFHVLLDFGINNFNNRAVSRDSGRITEYLPKIIQLKVLLAIVYLMIIYAVGSFIHYDPFLMRLLFFLGINQILLSFILYFRSNITALQKFKVDSLLSVFDKVLMIILCGAVIWLHVFSLEINIFLFVYIQTVSFALAAVIAFIANIRAAGFTFKFLEVSFIMNILKKSFPFALLGILMSVYTKIDAVMIERLLPETGGIEAGVYAASYRMLDAVNMIPFLFATILLPIYSKMIKEGGELLRITRLAFGLVIAISVVVTTSSIYFREELIRLLYIAAEPYWWSVFGVVIATFVPVSIMFVFGSLLTANGNLRSLNTIAGTSVVINVILNFYLILKIGALGAAWATLVTQWTVAIWHLYAARKYLGIPMPALTILKVGLLVGFNLVGAYLLVKTGINWVFAYLIIMILMFGCAASLKVFHPGEIIRSFGPEVKDEK